jgi:hypothetical protein
MVIVNKEEHENKILSTLILSSYIIKRLNAKSDQEVTSIYFRQIM